MERDQLLFCILQLWVIYTDAGRIHILNTRNHNIHKRDTTDQHVTPSGSERMPNEMEIRVDIDDGQSVNLDLLRNDHVGSMVPVVLGDGGKIRPWKSASHESYAVYTDSPNSAAMFVRANYENDYNGEAHHEFLGIFKKGDNDFTVEPHGHRFSFPQGNSSEDGQPSRAKRSAKGRHRRSESEPYDEIDYVIKAVNREDFSFEYDTVRIVGERDLFREEILDMSRPQFMSDIGDEFVNYGIETLIVVDYALYKMYYDLSDKDSSLGKQDDAINWIRYYYSHIINGVDLRFSSIRESDFGIYVRLAGFYIPLTPEDSPWTEGDTIREVDDTTGRVFTHAYRALSKFESWLDEFQDELPYFDQATLFAGNKLFGGYSDSGVRRNIAGLGEISGICTYYRTVLCQENGQYASIQTASHEIGHNLGAVHDGSQNDCLRTDQHIMAPVPVPLNDQNFYNPYSFSDCSVQEFRQQIALLNMRDMNCLTNAAQHLNQTELDEHLKVLPGQMFSLDHQCMNLFGAKSYYCGGAINDDQMCEKIVCYDPYLKKCWSGPEQRAATGTTCGNKRWC